MIEPRRWVRPVEFSPGTRPVKLMKGRALGKRRQSNTSAARHSAPILVTPVGGQPLHLVAEGVLLAPREEVCLDRLEAGVAQLHGGQVVRVGGRDGGSSKDTVASQRR